MCAPPGCLPPFAPQQPRQQLVPCATTHNRSISVLQACTTKGLLETFQDMDAKLERIQKSLENYLENKRQQVLGRERGGSCSGVKIWGSTCWGGSGLGGPCRAGQKAAGGC